MMKFGALGVLMNGRSEAGDAVGNLRRLDVLVEKVDLHVFAVGGLVGFRALEVRGKCLAERPIEVVVGLLLRVDREFRPIARHRGLARRGGRRIRYLRIPHCLAGHAVQSVAVDLRVEQRFEVVLHIFAGIRDANPRRRLILRGRFPQFDVELSDDRRRNLLVLPQCQVPRSNSCLRISKRQCRVLQSQWHGCFLREQPRQQNPHRDQRAGETEGKNGDDPGFGEHDIMLLHRENRHRRARFRVPRWRLK